MCSHALHTGMLTGHLPHASRCTAAPSYSCKTSHSQHCTAPTISVQTNPLSRPIGYVSTSVQSSVTAAESESERCRLHMAASLVCKQWNYIIKATWFISSRRMWESAEVLALVIGGYSGAVSAQCEVDVRLIYCTWTECRYTAAILLLYCCDTAAILPLYS